MGGRSESRISGRSGAGNAKSGRVDDILEKSFCDQTEAKRWCVARSTARAVFPTFVSTLGFFSHVAKRSRKKIARVSPCPEAKKGGEIHGQQSRERAVRRWGVPPARPEATVWQQQSPERAGGACPEATVSARNSLPRERARKACPKATILPSNSLLGACQGACPKATIPLGNNLLLGNFRCACQG